MSEESGSGVQPVIVTELKVGLTTLKTLIAWTWKVAYVVVPLLYLSFNWYRNQDDLVKKQAQTESRLQKLETDYNRQDRDLLLVTSHLEALKEQVTHDQAFYLAVQQHKSGR
jgi:hypothetical protein